MTMQLWKHFGHLVVTAVWAPLSEVAAAVGFVFGDKTRNEKYRTTRRAVCLTDIYEGFPPRGSAHRKKVFLMPLQEIPNRTLVVANLEDGWESLGYIASTKHNVEALILEVSTLHDEYPANAFTVVQGGSIVRHVSARKEDRWVFYEEGTRLAFENTALYAKRRIRDRMPPEEVVRIAELHGVALDSEDFILRPVEAVVFEQV